jgi:basic membrane lipoprotein Med (substrate-binding protein (PBP1-ABC) superfamily)
MSGRRPNGRSEVPRRSGSRGSARAATWRSAAVVAAVLVTGIVTWAVWPRGGSERPRARQYRDTVACMLTDARGLDGPQAAAAWAGMRDASDRTLVRVQYLKVDGAQTRQNAAAFLGSLVQSRCAVILAVGKAPVEALPAVAARFPDRRFIAAGGDIAASNVSVVDGDAAALTKAGHDMVADLAVD